MIERLFWSADSETPPSKARRLRLAWRLLAHFVLQALFSFFFGALFSAVYIVWREPPPWSFILYAGVVNLAAVTAAAYAARRLFDRRSFASLGLERTAHAGRDLAVGAAIPALMFLAALAVGLAAGWLRVEGAAWQSQPALAWLGGLLFGVILFLMTAWSEELVFRGYRWVNLRDGLNPAWAAVLSAVLFAALHANNPGFGWLGFAGLFLAGLFFAEARRRSRSLWLPLGLHFGWNFFAGSVLGFTVSGLELPALLRLEVAGPDWATGAAFGPEGGALLLPALAVGAALAWLYLRRGDQGV